jgi:putative colanic acid biosynthesis acetyltransferase WcaF
MTARDLNIKANRMAQKYSLRENVLRISWRCAQPLFRWSPRITFRWRASLLRLFGASVGSQVHIYPSVRVFAPWNLEIGDESAVGDGAQIYNLGVTAIGKQVTISQGAHLCAGTHDYTRPDLPLLKLPITIKDRVWICADAFIGPGVTVEEGAVIGARSVVVKDVEPWVVVTGNPASVTKERELTPS